MRIGAIVKITDGPFVGRLARFAGGEEQRVWVVVELKGRQLEMEMAADWISAAAPLRRPSSAIKTTGTQRWSSV